MKTNIYLCLDRQGLVEEVLVNEPVFLKVDSSHVESSTNGGDILISLEDGVISCKALNELEDATFNDHPIVKGGIYFFEPQDRLVMGLVSAYIKVKEVTEKTVAIKNPLMSETSEPTQEPNSPEEAFDFELKNINEVQKNIDIPSHDDSVSQTRTSIDIKELLNEVKEPNKKSKKKKKNKNETEDEDQDQLLDESKRNYVSKEKLSRKNKAQVKRSSAFKDLKGKADHNWEEENLVGPITRLCAVVCSIIISIGLYPYTKINEIEQITQKLSQPINSALAGLELPLIPQDVLAIGVIFILLEVVSTLLFSTSLPLFLIGVTTSGNFITKRLKAIIRLPLSLLSVVFPLGELPVLLGKKSLKETLTLSFIHYRLKSIKFVAPVILVFIAILGYSHELITTMLMDSKNVEVSELSSIPSASKRQYGHISYSEGLQNNVHIIGSSSSRALYSLVEKTSGHTIQLSEVKEISFLKLERLNEHSPLFSYGFPFLKTYFMTEKSNIKVRQDVHKIISTGLLFMAKKIDKIDPKLFPIAPAALDFVTKINLSADKMDIGSTGHYYLLNSGLSYEMLFIDDASIKVFAVEMTDPKMLKYLKRIQLDTRSALKGLTRTDAYLNLSLEDNDSTDLVAFNQELQELMREKAPSQYNKHIQSLINQVDQSEAPIDLQLSSKLEELLIK